MDIAGGCGAPIYAFAGGVVTTVVAGSESKSTAGAYVSPAGKVIIKHTEEFSSMYYHLKGSTTTVQVGDVVNAGDQIATQWSNGQSTGCHLHLEMYENGTRIDANVVLAAAGYIYSWTSPFTQAMLPPIPVAGDAASAEYTPDSAKQIALNQVLAKGWPKTEFDNCLVPLWEKESNWRVNALNPRFSPSSPPTPEYQAYGIAQAAPGSKMGTAGADWLTNPATQVTWGIGYIESRYGTPCGAWAHSVSFGWY
jgi:murein DD-endopeptidase MepM/ murein hydrolase activator NlpD